MDVEAETGDLRRVSEIEGSFGFLTRQISDVHKDLLAFEARTEQRFEKVDQQFKGVDQRFDRLESKVDALDRKIDSKVDGLAKALPQMIGDTMRDVMREERERKR